MGSLIVDKLDFNDPIFVAQFRKSLVQLVQKSRSYHELAFEPPYYFKTPRGHLPPEPGWYVIFEAESRKPLYVGEADNLDHRLNSHDGSRDNFGNPKRASEQQRNFIKKFREQGVISQLAVLIITENALCDQLGTKPPLSPLDRANVERAVDLYRSFLPL